MGFRRYPRFREPWGKCGTCGFDAPVSKLRFDSKYGWQCTGWPGATCADQRPDRDDYLARPVPSRPGEGSRRTNAPVTNTATEGIDTAGVEEGGFIDQLTEDE